MTDSTWTQIRQALETAALTYANGNPMALWVTMPDGSHIKYRSFEDLDRAISIAKRREHEGDAFSKISFKRPA